MADWRLRLAGRGDLDSLHAIACKKPVYRYMFDGEAPSRDFFYSRFAPSIEHAGERGLGLWLLVDDAAQCAGGVELRPYLAPRAAELSYLLDPGYWHQGLATRMAGTVISRAFQLGEIDAVIAGTDQPNLRSRALMQRLGMRFHRDVEYPLGAGVEYVLHRGGAVASSGGLLPLDCT